MSISKHTAFNIFDATEFDDGKLSVKVDSIPTPLSSSEPMRGIIII